MNLRLLCCLAIATAAVACGGRDAAPPAADSTTVPAPPAPEAAVPATGAPDAGAPGLLSSRGEVAPGTTAAGPAGGAGSAVGSGLDYSLPAGWKAQPPANSMRLAQATIPGPGGPGELAVFYFGPGQGGTAKDNITRWVKQLEMPAGAAPRQEAFAVPGFQITLVDASGTLQPSGMGMGPTEPQPGYRLLGAVIEGTGGPWFFKATGPEATLAAAREPFVAMLKGLKPKS
jgi:hypothetical protein